MSLFTIFFKLHFKVNILTITNIFTVQLLSAKSWFGTRNVCTTAIIINVKWKKKIYEDVERDKRHRKKSWITWMCQILLQRFFIYVLLLCNPSPERTFRGYVSPLIYLILTTKFPLLFPLFVSVTCLLHTLYIFTSKIFSHILFFLTSNSLHHPTTSLLCLLSLKYYPVSYAI